MLLFSIPQSIIWRKYCCATWVQIVYVCDSPCLKYCSAEICTDADKQSYLSHYKDRQGHLVQWIALKIRYQVLSSAGLPEGSGGLDRVASVIKDASGLPLSCLWHVCVMFLPQLSRLSTPL
jgi:hypothetical protein